MLGEEEERGHKKRGEEEGWRGVERREGGWRRGDRCGEEGLGVGGRGEEE